MSVLADIVVPAHDHAALLPLAVGTALDQTVRELRVVILGDGVGDDTRRAAQALCREDPRVVFLDLPKAGRTGEPHREPVVRVSEARIVTYLCDDDLLFPDHVETMLALLEHADLAHAPYCQVERDGTLGISAASLAEPAWRAETLAGRGLVGLTGLSHTVEAYQRLPHGWRETPPGVHTDQHMIRQFLEQSWCRVAATPVVTSLHLPSPARAGMTPDERHEELAALLTRATRPGGWDALRAEAHAALDREASRLQLQLVAARRRIAELEGELGRLPLGRRLSRRFRRALRPRPASR